MARAGQLSRVWQTVFVSLRVVATSARNMSGQVDLLRVSRGPSNVVVGSG
jgi:hypothetical protein